MLCDTYSNAINDFRLLFKQKLLYQVLSSNGKKASLGVTFDLVVVDLPFTKNSMLRGRHHMCSTYTLTYELFRQFRCNH